LPRFLRFLTFFIFPGTFFTSMLYRDKLCWPWSVLSWSAKLTTVFLS